jgi:hypothetical protein
MRSLHLTAAAGVLALTTLIACQDDKQVEVAPTAPAPTEAAASALTPAASPNLAVAIGKQVASICKAYRKAGVQAKADLAKNPGDTELQERVKALDEMIDDACN